MQYRKYLDRGRKLLIGKVVPEDGIEPSRLAPRDFKSAGAPSTARKLLNYLGSIGTIVPRLNRKGAQKGAQRKTWYLGFLAGCITTALAGSNVAMAATWPTPSIECSYTPAADPATISVH